MVGSGNSLEQELDDFNVPHGLRKRIAPSVQPVASEEEGVARRMAGQGFPDLAGQPNHVLIVLEDGDPLLVLVSC